MIRAGTFRFLFSLRNKIILLACGMPLLAALLVAGFAYHRLTDLAVNTALVGFAAETRLIAQRFNGAYEEIRNDAFVASHTPPIAGMIRAEQNGGVDPVDGSSKAIWKQRLETIFDSIMEAKPHYTEMSYVGLARGGRERVRVTRRPDGQTVSFDEAGLRSLEAEPLFSQAVKLAPDDYLVSDLSPADQAAATPSSFRVIRPVYERERLAGFIVVHVDYKKMLQRTLLEIRPRKECFIFNHKGDYISYENGVFLHLFEDRRHEAQHAPPFLKFASSASQTERALIDGEKISYFVKFFPDEKNMDSFIGVVLRTPKALLLQEASRIQMRIFALTSGIIAACLFLSIFFSRRLTRPLKDMTALIDEGERVKIESLPIGRVDEIGDLARALYGTAEKLHLEERRASAIFHNAFDGLFTLSADGALGKINPACTKIFGYASHELEGSDIGRIVPKPGLDALLRYMETFKGQSAATPYALEREIEGLRKDGRRFPMEISFTGTQIGEDTVFVGIVRDVSGRKRREELKDAFASTVNNELRGPLMTVQDSLVFLCDVAKPQLDDKATRILGLARENCSRLTAFLEDVLDIEKIASGKMVYNLEAVNICPLVHYIVETQQDAAEKYNVSIAVETACAKALCRIDSVRFVQAVVNLLSNAMKFSPDHGVVTVRVATKEREVHLSVTDCGPGIPVEFQSHVFERFAQAEQTSAKAKGGSGLGLSLAKAIVTAFDGRIAFESIEEKGTTFHIFLPLIEAGEGEGGL